MDSTERLGLATVRGLNRPISHLTTLPLGNRAADLKDENMNELEKVEAQLAELIQDKAELTSRLTAIRTTELGLMQRRWKLIHGIEIGSIVMCRGKEYRVVSIDANYGIEKPWVKGNPRLKNGEWGNARRELYSYWEIKAP